MILKKPTVKVPILEEVVDQQVALRETAALQLRISLLLDNIVRKIVDYPGCPQADMLLGDFRQLPINPDHKANLTPIKVAHMKDGVGVRFSNEDFLEDRVHSLIIPKKGAPEYRRQAVNVDCQKNPSRNIEYSGIEPMAAHPEIYVSLNFCMGALAVEASNGWTHHFK